MDGWYLGGVRYRAPYMVSSKLIVQNLLVEASLVLEKAWCQEDEKHPNVSWTENYGMKSRVAWGQEAKIKTEKLNM